MYERILIPTDGSEVAERAGEFAAAVASRLDADLHVISVEAPGGDLLAEDEGAAQHAVEAVAETAVEAGLDPTTEVVDTRWSVHGAIIGYAEEHDIDCIVMGTHGRTGVGRFLLGSVAEQTLRESPIPVLTVHEDTPVEFAPEKILVPTDGSDGARAAVDHAIDLAKATDATLHALYVTPDGRDAGTEAGDESADPLEAAAERASKARLGNVETATRTGRPHQAIAGYATEEEIDCIVMGTHGLTGLRRYLLGSVTERTVRFSPVPVVSVKAPRVTATVEFLDYEAVEKQGWSLDDGDLFEKAAEADLDGEAHGILEVDQGEYVLEAAEAEGYEWPFHCRAGACVNCAAVLVEGELEMEVDRGLDETEIEEENLRLTCVATPTTEEVQLVYNAKGLDSLRDRVI